MENKKGFIVGWQWIAGFFFIMLFFFLVMGLTDLVKVEFYDPLTDTIRNNTVNITGDNSSIYVLKQNELHATTDSITLPYNLILMIVTAYLMLMSIIDVMQRERQGFTSLLFGTIAGTIFLIFIIHLFVIGVLSWFNVEIIGKLFEDLINTNTPFYSVMIENWWFVFIWALVLSGANRLFGKEPKEEWF